DRELPDPPRVARGRDRRRGPRGRGGCDRPAGPSSGDSRGPAGRRRGGVTAQAKADPLIHPITRLSICGLLAAGADWVEFAALRDAAGISDSVLSKQSRVLEDAGYVEVRKGAVGRRPRTWFRLSAAGRQAVEGHLPGRAQLEEAVSASARDVDQAKPLAEAADVFGRSE